MFDLKGLIQKVRPIPGGEDGLAALAFAQEGRLYSYYRNVLLSTPTPEGFPDFIVKGDALLKAATADAKLSVSDTRLTIVSGKIRTWLPLDNESLLPEPVPTGEFTQVPKTLIATLKDMAKLVPNEAPRIWSTSLLLKGQYAYATDGEYIVRQKLEVQLPFTCALPKSLITVLAKLGKPLNSISFDDHVLYITFDDGSRLSSPVYAEQWPDVSDFFIAQDVEEVHPELLEFLGQVNQYADGTTRVEFAKPNIAKFRAGDTDVEAKFDNPWVKTAFGTSLKLMVDFVEKGAKISFAERFAIVKYEDRTIIIAAKVA